MKRILKRFLPKKLIYLLAAIQSYVSIKKSVLKQKSNVFLVQTPVHQNYGDHAIAYAELKMLKEFNVVEITDYQLNAMLKYPNLLKRLINNGIILITGGGNLGTLWFDIEANIRKTLQIFKDNRIIILPQTIYYHNTEFGKEQLEKSKEIYNSCADLTICAREKISYDFMKDIYNDVILVPDMALFLNQYLPKSDRHGALILLRDDSEKSTDNKSDIIISQLQKAYRDVEFGDMISPYKISPSQRENELNRKFDQFRSKEIILTDRLHGMIFSAITGTPCIVLNSKSPKIKGVYDWLLANCEYIIFTSNENEIDEFINFIKDKDFCPNLKIEEKFNDLVDLVRESGWK